MASPNPYLLSEKVGNGKFRYFALDVIIQDDPKDEDAAKKKCDALVNEILTHLEKCKEGAGVFTYPTLRLRVYTADRETADKQAANRAVLRLMKGKPMIGRKKGEAAAEEKKTVKK